MPSPRELLEAFNAERSSYWAASTVRGDLFYFERFLKFLEREGVDHVGSITFETLDAYKHRLDTVLGCRGKPLSPRYKQKSLAIPRQFLLWAYRRGHTLVDFAPYALPRVTSPTIQAPTVAQMRKLLAAPDASIPSGLRDLLILECFYTLGLRRHECYQLDVGDLSLRQQTLRVLGKPLRERLMPLSARLCRLLEEYLQVARPRLRAFPDEQALWIAPSTGQRLGDVSIRHMVARTSVRVGLPKLYPHLLRHACATHMFEAGADITQIQAFLGHSRISSTERYVRVSPDEMASLLKRCHPRTARDEAP